MLGKPILPPAGREKEAPSFSVACEQRQRLSNAHRVARLLIFRPFIMIYDFLPRLPLLQTRTRDGGMNYGYKETIFNIPHFVNADGE